MTSTRCDILPGARRTAADEATGPDGAHAPPEAPGSACEVASGVRRVDPTAALERLAQGNRADRITHVERVAARAGSTEAWPDWVDPLLRQRLVDSGIEHPWSHQVATAQLAWQQQHVVAATGTASGKSLGYLLPALTEIRRSADAAGNRQATALYLAPTKALAADQQRAVSALRLPDVRAATLDGDSSWEERDWARDHATYVLSNPDMLHRSLLPGHARWSRFWRSVRYVIVDECHHYRGVFGAHVAQVLRRLRRIAAHHGADPVFVLASATVSEPAVSAERLIGAPVEQVVVDGSPRGELAFALWEPPLTAASTDAAPHRRSTTSETADVLADLVLERVRSVAFVRSRHGAESVALQARDHLSEVDAELPQRIAAYRGGYLREERRALERALHRGELLGVSATNALELGVDISGLDAVVLAGFPGTRFSLWQQAGRAGRAGQGALAVLIARDDPLDTYLVRHPDMIFGAPVEATVFDPDNPHVVRPHLAAAAAEVPLQPSDVEQFGPQALAAADALVADGLLRRRRHGWFWARRGRACDLADIRSAGGEQVRVVELTTGRLLGTVDAASAPRTVHEGAVYVHQGESFVVDRLDLDDAAALVVPDSPDYTTLAREDTDIRVLSTERSFGWGSATLSFGEVEVTQQVVGYQRRRVPSGELLGEESLDMPRHTLTTKAVWWTLSDEQIDTAGVQGRDVPGAAHAAEHASIGLLPLFATCDRWDIGGVSTEHHPDTEQMTVFVYDGYPGGAGFAERGFDAAAAWLAATRDAIVSCECADGCPSCVQSPKCGNGNHPLDKAAAVQLLDALLASAGGSGGLS